MLISFIISSACLFVRLSVSLSIQLSAFISATPTGRIYMKFGTGDFDESLLRNSKFGSNRTKISDTLHGDLTKYVLLLSAILNRQRSALFE